MSTVYALLFIVATIVLIVGLARKIIQYAKTPAPLKIPTTPAPVWPERAAFAAHLRRPGALYIVPF